MIATEQACIVTVCTIMCACYCDSVNMHAMIACAMIACAMIACAMIVCAMVCATVIVSTYML